MSEAAIHLAREKAQKLGHEITWMRDDILDTKLERQFELIFDRGLLYSAPSCNSSNVINLDENMFK
jgi:hypothetical protein